MWTSNTAWIIPVCGSNHIWRNILIIIWFPGRVEWIVRGLPMIPFTPLLLPLHPGPCVPLQRTSWKLHKLQNAPEDLKNFWYTSKHPCKAHHCTLYSYILFCEGVMLSLAGLYGDHFYISMKGCAILGPPLGPHELSNIYAFLLEVVWWGTVEPLPNVEQLPNSDPMFSKQDWSFWLIESQLSQCKCIVKLRTMSYNKILTMANNW